MMQYSIKPDVMKEFYSKDGDIVPEPVMIDAIQITFGDRAGDYIVQDRLGNIYICDITQFKDTYQLEPKAKEELV